MALMRIIIERNHVVLTAFGEYSKLDVIIQDFAVHSFAVVDAPKWDANILHLESIHLLAEEGSKINLL